MKIIMAYSIQLLWVVICVFAGIMLTRWIFSDLPQPWSAIVCVLFSVVIYIVLYKISRKKYMKKIFQCLGAGIYSTVTGYLLWLLFHWMTPYVMGVGWLLFFLYIFVAGGLITGIIASINNLLVVPMVFLMKNNIVAKIINVLPLLFFGYSAVRLPWGLDMNYGVLQYLIGISLTITFLISFGSMIILPFKIEEGPK